MKDLGYFKKIYIVTSPVDFRMQARGLSNLVEHHLDHKPTSPGKLFVFTNKRKTAIKALYWDHTGFALWWKGLEKDRFRWPKKAESSWVIDPKSLKWLLEGVDLSKINRHENLYFD